MGLWQHVWDRVQGKAPKGAKRSKGWRKVRNDHIFRHPACAICGKIRGVEAHHCVPFFLAPDLENKPGNLITLCRKHHFTFGHLEDWQRVNPAVKSDAAEWAVKIQGT